MEEHKINDPEVLKEYLLSLGYDDTQSFSCHKLLKLGSDYVRIEVFLEYKCSLSSNPNYSHRVLIDNEEYWEYFSNAEAFDDFIISKVAMKYAKDKLQNFKTKIQNNLFN